MFWTIAFYLVFVLKVLSAYPIGAWSDTALAFDLTSDYTDNFYGPWSLDYLRGNRLGAGGFRSWPYDRYGPYGGDLLDPFYSSAYGLDLYSRDYTSFSGYPKTTEFAKENYVRDHPYGGTEVGIRDSVSMRNGPWRSSVSRSLPPYSARSGGRFMDRFYNPFPFDYDFPGSAFRRPFYPALSAARPSSLRWGGDFTYLRR